MLCTLIGEHRNQAFHCSGWGVQKALPDTVERKSARTPSLQRIPASFVPQHCLLRGSDPVAKICACLRHRSHLARALVNVCRQVVRDYAPHRLSEDLLRADRNKIVLSELARVCSSSEGICDQVCRQVLLGC